MRMRIGQKYITAFIRLQIEREGCGADLSKRKQIWKNLCAGERDTALWVNYSGGGPGRPLPYPEKRGARAVGH